MAADIREWTDTDIDPQTRREIFKAAGMGSIWNVSLNEIQHLGATGLYNINGNAAAYGKFIAEAGDLYNAYQLDNPNVTNADGTILTLGETQVIGFDLSVNDSLVMPIRKDYEAYDDPTLLRVQKQGFFGWKKNLQPFIKETLCQNPSNSGKALPSKDAGNPERSPVEGNVQRLVERRTSKRMETGETLKGFDIVWSYMKNISGSLKNGIRLAPLYEHKRGKKLVSHVLIQEC